MRMARGFVTGGGEEATNTARLLFNYDLGIEVEILQYLDGPNYLDVLNVPSRSIAHIGMHLRPDAQSAVLNRPFLVPVAQQVETFEHQNPGVPANRRYRYTIYDARLELGHCLKVIERLEVEP
jgi:hypothetical protein